MIVACLDYWLTKEKDTMEKYQNKNLFFAFDVIYKKDFLLTFCQKVITNEHVLLNLFQGKWEKFVKQSYENNCLR